MAGTWYEVFSYMWLCSGVTVGCLHQYFDKSCTVLRKDVLANGLELCRLRYVLGTGCTCLLWPPIPLH